MTKRSFCRALTLAIALGATTTVAGQVRQLEAPNVVPISPRLVTSGQPTAAALAGLKAMGFEAVIYLAPPTVPDAVGNEALIVARQGISFVNLPIAFTDPTDADFEQFSAVLQAMGDRKTLVHCQVNLRASSFVFLYRVIVLREDPNRAYENLSGVWVPEGAWKRLIERQLRKHDMPFEIL